MNKVIQTALVGLVVLVGNAQAYDKHRQDCDYSHKAPAEKTAGEHLDKITKDLNLSPEQRAKVETFLEEKMAKKRQILDEKHAALKALYEESHAKMKGVLSEEQMKQWEVKKEHCPDCKDGKICEKRKSKKDKKGAHSHHHEYDEDARHK